MVVFRICREKYCQDLSGTGAKIAGGRWNSKGISVLYTSESRALAMAEVAVHLSYPLLNDDFVIVSLEIPKNAVINTIEIDSLPDDWDSFPFNHNTQSIGNKFIKENKYLAMKVPSAVVEGDYNILLNPWHKDFSKIKVVEMKPFIFDKRLIEK